MIDRKLVLCTTSESLLLHIRNLLRTALLHPVLQL